MHAWPLTMHDAAHDTCRPQSRSSHPIRPVFDPFSSPVTYIPTTAGPHYFELTPPIIPIRVSMAWQSVRMRRSTLPYAQHFPGVMPRKWKSVVEAHGQLHFRRSTLPLRGQAVWMDVVFMRLVHTAKHED